MRKIYAGVILALTLAGAAYATERAVNKYTVHKLAINSVLVSCNDEREPVVRKLENTTFVIVTCQVQEERTIQFK